MICSTTFSNQSLRALPSITNSSTRIEKQDFRRLRFKKQIELISRLSERWGFIENQVQEQILRVHPFDDMSDARLQASAAVGWTKACEQYPLPRMSGEANQDTHEA
jgi:hypothetical protein